MQNRCCRIHIALVFCLVTFAWLACHAPGQSASAQARWDDVVPIKRPPANPRRRAPIARPAQPNRRAPARARTAPTVERAALLTLQWRIVKFKEDGYQEETSGGATFMPNDKIRLAVKANQGGYLYIIRQNTPGAEGQLLFPDKRHLKGKNFVQKNQEYILPSDCSNFEVPCWYSIQPPAGQELFTLIFSREPIEELPNDATEGGAPIAAQVLTELKSSSSQKLTRQQGTFNSRYTIWIRNTNTEDNEEIIETLVLIKGNASPVAASATASPGKH